MEKLIIGDLPVGSESVERMEKPKKLIFKILGKEVFTAEAVIDHKKSATFRQWQKPGSILPQHMIQKYSHWLRDYGKWAHQVNSKAKPVDPPQIADPFNKPNQKPPVNRPKPPTGVPDKKVAKKKATKKVSKK